MDKFQERECKKHGLTSFVLEGRGHYRCRKCRVDSVTARRRKIKLLAVEYKGGSCQNCGYDRCVAALDFHHEGGKDFAISAKGNTISWERVKAELDKCVLLCANCHREVHSHEQETIPAYSTGKRADC